MTLSILIAAPLLIAAIAGAVRFVGCTEDFDQFLPPDGEDGNGGENGNAKEIHCKAAFSGSGQLTATATLGHDAEETPFATPGTYTYDIPSWCTEIDLFVLGGGGGGGAGVPTGRGGEGGHWDGVALWRGLGDGPAGTIPLPASTTSITITVGSGGVGGTDPNSGGNTTATADGMTPLQGTGGSAAFSSDTTGLGPQPPDETVGGTTKSGGTDQTAPDGEGIAPGGGGAGGLFGGGNGADGQAWVIARQT